MASIRDVAKRANVGATTVSRALNGTGYVAKDTRIRIEKAIKELNYMPNELARNLFRNCTGIIGVLIPDLENPFWGEMVRFIEDELYQSGYKTMVCCSTNISNREKEYLDMLERNIVDGIIVAAYTLEDDEFLRVNKPIVSLDRDFGEKIPLIHSDHKKGGRLAAEKLLENGCRNIIQFCGRKNQKCRIIAEERHQEFARFIEENGANVWTLPEDWNNWSDFNQAMEGIEKIVAKYGELDGVFVTDHSAVCLSNVVRVKGIEVPRDVKIVSHDGMRITRMVNPQITAIVQDTKGLAEACVKTLMQLIQGKEVDYHQILDVTMQDGGTTY